MDPPIIDLQVSPMDTVWIAFSTATTIYRQYIDPLIWLAN